MTGREVGRGSGGSETRGRSVELEEEAVVVVASSSSITPARAEGAKSIVWRIMDTTRGEDTCGTRRVTAMRRSRGRRTAEGELGRRRDRRWTWTRCSERAQSTGRAVFFEFLF